MMFCLSKRNERAVVGVLLELFILAIRFFYNGWEVKPFLLLLCAIKLMIPIKLTTSALY